jgi:hypothetical protein
VASPFAGWPLCNANKSVRVVTEIVDFTSETVVHVMTNPEAKFNNVRESPRCLQNHSCQLATLAEILEGIFQLK